LQNNYGVKSQDRTCKQAKIKLSDFSRTYYTTNRGIYEFEKLFDIKLPKGTVWEELYDDHGGFLGDGSLLY